VRRLLTLLGAAGMAGGLLLAQSADKTAILNSKHDFRANSGTAIRSTSVEDACVFCHTPHEAAGSGAYLWNHKGSEKPASVYNSTTVKSDVTPMQPGDASKLCMSCHDGTIALGDTMNNGMIPFVQGSAYALPPNSSTVVGGYRGLAGDHPVGFDPAPGIETHDPPPGDPVHLDGNHRLQCTTCHDPHQQNLDPVVGKFLVKRNEASAICLSCHALAAWMDASHRQPRDPSDDMRYTAQFGAHTGYVGVSKNGCESCHRPHSSQQGQRLLKFIEENTCYQCHSGNVAMATGNIRAEMQGKIYRHPVEITPSVHDAAESPTSPRDPLPEISSAAPRHSECVDCHDPHSSNATPAQPPSVSGALLGVSGQSVAGTYLPQSTHEYEVCFKCHADSANKPQFFDTSTAGIGYGRNPQRQFNQGNPNRYNTRLEFQFGMSFHPVTRASNLSAGPGGEVASLRPQPTSLSGAPLPGRTLSSVSQIYCTDCHNNDTGRNAGIPNGPSGPHGSNIPHLLEREDVLEAPPATPGGVSPGAAYSPANYALCNKCHDVVALLQERGTQLHSLHVRQENAACETCHDPHASQAPMLINFDLSIVGPSSSGRLEYQRTGIRQGTCYLRCHGQDHNLKRYGPGN
jgi:predicted CXXCH cytochrome family protein